MIVTETSAVGLGPRWRHRRRCQYRQPSRNRQIVSFCHTYPSSTSTPCRRSLPARRLNGPREFIKGPGAAQHPINSHELLRSPSSDHERGSAGDVESLRVLYVAVNGRRRVGRCQAFPNFGGTTKVSLNI